MKYLAVIILFLNIATAHGQQYFGAQFKEWVLSEAGRDSRALANADYKERVLHTITKIDERVIQDLNKADSIINAVYFQIQKDENELKDLDSLHAILQRARSARLAHLQLLEAENLLYFASGLKSNLDSLGSPSYFYGLGLYHVGRETLLESYTTIGEQFAENFQLKYRNDYTIGFNATFNSEGTVTSGQAELGQGGMYTAAGTALGAYIGAVPGAVIGSVIGGTIDYFLSREKAKKAQEKAEKEYKEQMKLLQEGIEALPGQLTPVDTLLSYFQAYVKHFSESNSEIYQSIDSTLKLEQRRFKEVFSYNVQRQQLSQQQLTADRVASIERDYRSLEELRNFYSNLGAVNFINDCNQMIGRLTAEENWLRTASISRFDWLQRSEAYQDDLRFALVLIYQFLSDETYLPYQKYLLQKKSFLEKMSIDLPTQQLDIPEIKMVTASLNASNSNKMVSNVKQNLANSTASPLAKSLHLVLPQQMSIKMVSGPSLDFGICFGSGGYTLCDGINNGSYGDRFNNGGRSPISDILGSSHDGGMRSFSVKANGQINQMKENIRKRVEDLKKDYSKLADVMPEARSLYSFKINQVAKSAVELGTASTEEIHRFKQDFETMMPILQHRLDQFMNQPLRTGLNDLNSDLRLQRKIKDRILPANMPVSIYRIGNVEFGYPSEGKPAIEVAWEREAAKQAKTLEEIERRVNGNVDPVFNDFRKLNEFRNNLGQIDRILRSITDDDYYSFEDRRQISSHYLAQAVKMRYAASGKLPVSDLEQVDYPFLSGEQLDRLNSLVNNFKKCNSDDEDCMSAFSNAVYQVYRNNSLVGLRNQEGKSFTSANLQQLAISSTSWEAVGSGRSAGAVNQAALLAISGNIVIATRADGMDTRVGIVLPELPKIGTEGHWDGLPVPSMFYLDEDKPESSFARDRMSASFPEPGEVIFYTNRQPPSYYNKTISILDRGISSFDYSDPIASEKGEVPSVNIRIQTNNQGVVQSIEQSIPIAGDYVGRIVQQFGNNSKLVFENIYFHRDEIYGSYPTDPEGLTSIEIGQLKKLRQLSSQFENKDRLLTKPDGFYYCQTGRFLYNSCISELSKADPLDRKKILDYYNRVVEALVKYQDDMVNLGTILTPGINDARDLYEFVTGKDMITGVLLSIWERGLSGAGLLIGSGAFYRQINNLPMVQQTALDIAQRSIPDFKLIQFGNQSYFLSKEGIHYERWSSRIDKDRLTKIVEDHYGIATKKSRFYVNDANEIPGLIDEAWKRAKDLHLIPTIGDKNNIKYIVDMERQVGQKKNQRFIHLVFERDEPYGIVTAFPSKTGRYPQLD